MKLKLFVWKLDAKQYVLVEMPEQYIVESSNFRPEGKFMPGSMEVYVKVMPAPEEKK